MHTKFCIYTTVKDCEIEIHEHAQNIIQNLFTNSKYLRSIFMHANKLLWRTDWREENRVLFRKNHTFVDSIVLG